MKRGELKRRTELKRGGGLKRTPGPQRKGRLSPVSKKRQATRDERSALYARVRTEQGNNCAWPRCTEAWVDLHEVLTRARGGDILNRDHIIGLCRRHNEKATDTRPAECLGVVIPSWASSNLDPALAHAELLRASVENGQPQPCAWHRDGRRCASPDGEQRRRCELLRPPVD